MKKTKINKVVGLYVQEDGKEYPNGQEMWLAPECPYDCKSCENKSVLDVKFFREEDKFYIKKIVFKNK